jgi:Flp pilus assembly protein TadG
MTHPIRHLVRLRGRSDAGLSTIEVVVLAPVIMLFVLVLVAFGLLVDGRGQIDGAARDAARAGSLQRSSVGAMRQARLAAAADLGRTCTGAVTVRKLSTGFTPGGLFTVQVSCKVRGLDMLGLNVATDLAGRSSAPLDPFRRAV